MSKLILTTLNFLKVGLDNLMYNIWWFSQDDKRHSQFQTQSFAYEYQNRIVSGGYKGYGMGALVEIFCGILGGSHWGPNIRRWGSDSQMADLVGHM